MVRRQQPGRTPAVRGGVWEMGSRCGRRQGRAGKRGLGSPGAGSYGPPGLAGGDDWVMRRRRFRASSGARSPPVLPCNLASLPPSLGGPRLAFHHSLLCLCRQQCQLLPWAVR